MESASYMENNPELKINDLTTQNVENINENNNEEYIPKLFSEEHSADIPVNRDLDEKESENELFNQDTIEDEDFEIPAFLRRQKF